MRAHIRNFLCALSIEPVARVPDSESLSDNAEAFRSYRRQRRLPRPSLTGRGDIVEDQTMGVPGWHKTHVIPKYHQ